MCGLHERRVTIIPLAITITLIISLLLRIPLLLSPVGKLLAAWVTRLRLQGSFVWVTMIAFVLTVVFIIPSPPLIPPLPCLPVLLRRRVSSLPHSRKFPAVVSPSLVSHGFTIAARLLRLNAPLGNLRWVDMQPSTGVEPFRFLHPRRMMSHRR